MIELYQLRWSHYVEKVRWALDFKGLAWRAIDIVAYKKQEMSRFPCAQTVPLIHDASTGVALSDSSPILRYLDEAYPEQPLLPADPVAREEAWQWMLRLDSTLGLQARRLGYTQLIMECPDALPRLFMTQPFGGLFARPVWRSLAAPVLGMMLTKRFRFDRNRQDRIYERLENLLLPLAQMLERNAYVMGEKLSAVDITLASLLRPLRIVPHFSHHPRLQGLFVWQQRLFRSHGRDAAYPYETMIEAQRQRSGAMRGRVSWMETPSTTAADAERSRAVAANDQHSVNGLSLFKAWPGYLKLRWFSGVGKQVYSPAPYLEA
ncbi:MULTISPECIES: glutathione S-transferase family protein [unclassified Dyella]|uniref:glutathione S-transferase family protein n=1 Tax=unclassified Dyella TaxID=2634549 RepID=UPI000CA89E0E|nr:MULTISPECIES: glutathione S-transferase family protein [unclassified Dyella]MDR3444966.1 glutathione S-transferase family protein [Dyella sp.]PMQ05078.1 Stringent starvation protein A [Dyella sp. AD56]